MGKESKKSCSVVKLCLTLCDPTDCSFPGHEASQSFTISQSLLKLMSTESVMPSNNFILCRPLLLLPPVFSNIKIFPNESVLCVRWTTYWSFTFSISPSNEYLGLISFRMDWFDLFGVQGTLKSLLLHHSSKPSVLQRSAFFMVQFSNPYVTTEKLKLTQYYKSIMLFNLKKRKKERDQQNSGTE